jgi:hypothetical protein
VPQALPNPPAHVPADLAFLAARRRFDAPAPLRLWHLTSLDAPTVAVVWTLAFAWAAGVRLPAWIPTLLALAAWAVYIADRLLDARSAFRRGQVDGLRERHHFHHRHRRVLIPISVLAACAAAWIVFTLMPNPARERDSLLACAALAYFTRVHAAALQPAAEKHASRAAKRHGFRVVTPRLFRPRLFKTRLFKPLLFKKELLVGVLFTAACALPALSRVWTPQSPFPLPLLAVALVLALLAWLNCYAIDRWEALAGSSHTGIAARAGLLALVAAVPALLFAAQHPRLAAMLALAAASSLLLALLDRLRPRLTPLALRALADLVLLTPIFLLAPALPRP